MRRGAVLALFVLTACAREASTRSAYTTRDSAGIRIVEYPTAPVAPTFTLPNSPIFRVGDDAGEREMAVVTSGALLPNGGAVIVDNGELVRIAPDGAATTVLARKGQGPAELAGVSAMLSLGADTLLVQDPRNAKVVIFAGDSLLGAWSTSADAAIARSSKIVGRAGGAFLMILESLRDVQVGGWVQGRLLRMDATGKVDSVGTYDLTDPAGLTSGRRPAYPPFGTVVGAGNGFVGARSDVVQVTWWGPDGSFRQILRWPAERVYPKETDVDSLLVLAKPELRRLNRSISDEEIDELVKQQRELMIVDPSVPYPFFRNLLGDGAGGTWLSGFDVFKSFEFDPLPRWSIIGPDGEFRGEITLPDRFRLLDVRGDRVLGVLTDSLDVQSVAVYQIQDGPVAP